MSNLEVTRKEPADAADEPGAAQPSDPKLKLLMSVAAILAAQGGDQDSELNRVTASVRDHATRDPLHALLATVVGGGLLYHHLERGAPNAPRTALESILKVASSLNAGGGLAPTTSGGTALAAVVHTFGPALAMNALNAPAAETAEREREARRTSEELLAVNRLILQRLSEIAANTGR
jgi:hypothetical protein